MNRFLFLIYFAFVLTSLLGCTKAEDDESAIEQMTKTESDDMGLDTNNQTANRSVNNEEYDCCERMPAKVHNELPVYPPEAKRAGIEGHVWLRMLVDTAGHVKNVIIQKESGLDVGFEDAARAAAYRHLYQPVFDRDSVPMEIWVTERVLFSLDDTVQTVKDTANNHPW